MIVDKQFRKISIIGVGLIGGSIGMALKERSFNGIITGIERSRKKLIKAKDAGIIDDYSTSIKSAKNADLIVICTPVSSITGIYRTLYPLIDPKAIVTDVGSTKEKIMHEISKIEKEKRCFIGSHPIAGSEKSGFESASSHLFDKSVVAVIKNSNTDNNKLEKINSFWKYLGASTVNLSSKEHDQTVALTSHIPHIISCLTAYSCMKNDKNNNKFRDIYGNGLWMDIFASNKKNILNGLKQYRQYISLFERLIRNNDHNKLRQIMNSIKLYRKVL